MIVRVVVCPSARAAKKFPARGIIERAPMIFDMGCPSSGVEYDGRCSPTDAYVESFSAVVGTPQLHINNLTRQFSVAVATQHVLRTTSLLHKDVTARHISRALSVQVMDSGAICTRAPARKPYHFISTR
jgi:hypothetical protein